MAGKLQHGGHDLPVKGGNDRRRAEHDKPKTAQEMHAAAIADMSLQAKATVEGAKTRVPANHVQTRPGLRHPGGHPLDQPSPQNPGRTAYSVMPLPPGTPPQAGFDSGVPPAMEPVNARPGLTHGAGHHPRASDPPKRYMPVIRASISHSSEKGGHKAGSAAQFIASAIKRPGALTKAVGGKPGKNLGKTRQLAKTGSPRQRREAQFYLNVLRH